jgi:hypothetical protein
VLLLDKVEDGTWGERTVKLRLPKKYAAEFSGKSIKLSNCLDSKVWVTDNLSATEAAEHLEYTIHFVLSSQIGLDWPGGSIEARTGCGDLTIPVSILQTP